jgi:hypothetical protein
MSQMACHGFEPSFARSINCETAEVLTSSNGRYINDASGAEKLRSCSLDHHERASQVGADDRREVLISDVAERRRRSNVSVIDENINAQRLGRATL